MKKRAESSHVSGRLQRFVHRVRGFLTADLWSMEIGGLSSLRRLLLRASRVLYVAIRGFHHDRCMFHAAALTYVTVLSIVPVLAFAFSMAKGLGAYDRLVQTVIEPALDQFLPSEQRAETGVVDEDSAKGASAGLRQAIDRVLEFVDETDVSKLGLFGLAVLAWTVVKMLGSVEDSFNEIFWVKSSRSLVRKVTDYLAIVIVTPIFLLAAGALIGATRFSPEFVQDLHVQPLLQIGLRIAPLFVAWIGFTFLYMCLPSRRMPVWSAFLGGVGGGTLWFLLQVAFLELQIWTARFNELYASFAAFPLFLVWVYLSWGTVLFGAELASAHLRAPTYRGSAYVGPIPQAFAEVIALRALVFIAESFLRGAEPWSVARLSERMHVPEPWIDSVVAKLVEERILAELGDKQPPPLVPARDLDAIRVSHVLSALRGDRMQESFPPRSHPGLLVERILANLDAAVSDAAHDPTLRELGLEVLRAAEEPEPRPATAATETA